MKNIESSHCVLRGITEEELAELLNNLWKDSDFTGDLNYGQITYRLKQIGALKDSREPPIAT